MNESIRRLEEKIAYLERHVTEQDKVMLEFAEQLAALRRELAARHEAGATRGASDIAGAADLPDERPPHY